MAGAALGDEETATLAILFERDPDLVDDVWDELEPLLHEYETWAVAEIRAGMGRRPDLAHVEGADQLRARVRRHERERTRTRRRLMQRANTALVRVQPAQRTRAPRRNGPRARARRWRGSRSRAGCRGDPHLSDDPDLAGTRGRRSPRG